MNANRPCFLCCVRQATNLACSGAPGAWLYLNKILTAEVMDVYNCPSECVWDVYKEEVHVELEVEDFLKQR